MKKILALTLAIFMVLVTSACGNKSEGEATSTPSGSVAGNVDSEESGFAGTWVHERTDAEPFSMTLTLNADGTGKSGKTTGVEWSLDAANEQISIALVFPDGSKEDPSFAKLTEDNKLCWERNFTVKTATEEFLTFDKVVFERS